MFSDERKILLIAPHPDDIAYSCLLPTLVIENHCTVMTIFGRSRYVFGTSDNKDIDKVSAIRKHEDLRFCKFIKAEQRYFNFPDSSITFSNDKSYEELYPIRNELTDLIKSEIGEGHYHCIYFPMALGWHYDHSIIRELIVDDVIPLYRDSCEFVMYKDLPYALDFSEGETEAKLTSIMSKFYDLQFFKYTMSLPEIERLNQVINIYASQYESDVVAKLLQYKVLNGQVVETFYKLYV